MKKILIAGLMSIPLLITGCESTEGTHVRDVKRTATVIEMSNKDGQYKVLLDYNGYPVVDTTEEVYKLCKANMASNKNVLLNLRLTEVDGRLEKIEVVNVNNPNKNK